MVIPSDEQYNYTLSVQLNDSALQALNSGSGIFALGMKNTTLNPHGYFVFSSGSQLASQQLVLTTSPVPEASTKALMGLGIVSGALLAARRSKKFRG